jgi:hypothetical protein
VSLTLYQQAAGRSSAAWATFGICVRQAQALGCIFPQYLVDCSTQGYTELGSFDINERSTEINLA